MLIILNTILFGGLYVFWLQIKKAKNNKKYLQMTAWIVLAVIFCTAFSMYKQSLKDEVRSQHLQEIRQNNKQQQNNEIESLIPEDTKDKSNNKVENISVKEVTSKERTLGEMAQEAPKPNIYIKGMKPITDGEGFYIEFDTYFTTNELNGLICDYVDSNDKNELVIQSLMFNNTDASATFSSMTELQRKNYVDRMKATIKSREATTGAEITLIDDGYFKVNGNVVIWINGIVKNNDVFTQNVFYYLVAKNKKIYFIAYFTLESINNQPNDTILTSLNTLKIN